MVCSSLWIIVPESQGHEGYFEAHTPCKHHHVPRLQITTMGHLKLYDAHCVCIAPLFHGTFWPGFRAARQVHVQWMYDIRSMAIKDDLLLKIAS